MKLIIGNQNYSSWSLRPWLLLKHFDVEFETEMFWLSTENRREKLAAYSPSCRVPVLLNDNVSVWDTLAICEYVSEQFLAGKGWPAAIATRAKARAVVCEMHAGFTAIRNELPMNCRATRTLTLSEDVQREIERIDTIFSDALGPWLFGEFTIADCFFAPVVVRFKTYGVQLSEKAGQYGERVLTHPAMLEWVTAALKETEILHEDEAGANA